MMKNRNLLIGVVVVVLVAFVGGYAVMGNKSSAPQEPQVQPEQDIAEVLSPEDIGLTFTLRSDNKAAKFAIGKADDIATVEYQISYTKDVKGEEVPEGLIGEVKADSGGELGIAYREFGTCSSGTCRYDNVVSPVKLTLKITKTNGKVYSVEKTLEI